MMPGASPTNAIAFSTGKITVPDMVKTGLWFNLICAIGILLAAYYLIPVIMGFDPFKPPAWSLPQAS
jgi:sodium-dependent dicarboxylate transporter 2/3/5